MERVFTLKVGPAPLLEGLEDVSAEREFARQAERAVRHAWFDAFGEEPDFELSTWVLPLSKAERDTLEGRQG